jgi:ATP-dependent Clp protease ATP-binding subunit ClpA
VVEKFILELEIQLTDRGVHILLTDEAKAWLTRRGYDKQMGARPMGRLIQEEIKKPLADELLFGKLVKGGEVRVHLKDDKISFEIVSAATPMLPAPDGDAKQKKRRKPVEPA